MRPQKGQNDLGRNEFLAKLRLGLDRCGVTAGDRMLVALSGGTDSTALLLGVAALVTEYDPTLKVEAVHFDHGLLGDQSGKDIEYCETLCASLDIALHVGSGDVYSRVSEAGLSIEAAARDLRYRYFAEFVSERRFRVVVTGHTLDDQAETVLLALTRGAGLRGASGMRYVTERNDISENPARLTVVRPMLAISRAETEHFCAVAGVEPLQDESNTDVAFSRNRIRHQVLPALREINPGVSAALARFADLARADASLIETIALAELEKLTLDEGGAISKARFRQLPEELRSHVFVGSYRQALGSSDDLDANIVQSAVRAVCELDSGRIDLPNGLTLVIEHDAFRLLIGEDDPSCPYPKQVGEHRLERDGAIVFDDNARLSVRFPRLVPDLASLNRWQALLDSRVIGGDSFTVRTRRSGDRFHALGMESEMKLQDFFVNQHIPERWRDRMPLVVTGRGICWVVGHRIAEWAKVTERTDQIVLLEFYSSRMRGC